LEGTVKPPPGGPAGDDPGVHDARGPEALPAAEQERLRAEEERRRRRDHHIEAAVWAVMGALVVLYLFFAVLGAIDPIEAPFATFVVALLALAWLSHAWDRLYRGGHVSRPDRERRGF
jgi:hypothetical protein